MSDGAWRERTIRDAVLAGDADAWRRWYDAHFDRLAGYVRWRCGGLRDLADDVIQETWLVAVRRLRSFDPERGAFFDWLCGIASNAARGAIRARGRQKARARALVPADDKAAADATDATDKAQRVAAALATLPDHYEAVLRLKYLGKIPAVAGLRRISKPGLRVYARKNEMPRVLGGLGVAIVSTSSGLMTGREAERKGLGGEVLAYVW